MQAISPGDAGLVHRLPLPLAQLFRRALNAREPLKLHQAAYFLWEAALKLLGAVAVVSYAEHGDRDPQLDQRLTNLARPALGHWWEFVRLLVPVLAEAGDQGFQTVKEALFGQALDDLERAAALDAALRQELDGTGSRKKVRLGELFERLVRYRNQAIGHGAVGQRQPEFYERLGKVLLAGMADILGRVCPLAGGRMVYIAEVKKHKSGHWIIERDELTGEMPQRLPPLSLPLRIDSRQLPNAECLYLEVPAGQLPAGQATAALETPAGPIVLRSLQPLLTFEPGTGLVYFLNAQQGQRRTQYLCYDNASVVDREELTAEQQDLLARLVGAPVDGAKAGQWAAQAQAEEEDHLAAREEPAPAPVRTDGPDRPPASALRVALLYRRHAQPDEQLVHWLEKAFTAHGFQVFVDRHLTIGVEWAKELENQVRTADAVVVLLSPASVHSEMMACEIQAAHDESQKRNGRPRLLPIRINFEGALPSELAVILDRLQYFLWHGPQDHQPLLAELLQTLRRPPALQAIPPPAGVLALDSRFYVVRPTDEEFQAALARRDSIILLRGARQMGKTSLLARGLQQARVAEARVVLTDFQKLNAAELQSADTFFHTLAEWLADELNLEVPATTWSPRRGPSVNFERYLRREVLDKVPTLVWAMDEVDRLFPCPFASEVFGLFRCWHNARGLDPASPWSRLTLAIAYATEAHLFITDLNQSPFNVGTLLALEDFTPAQVAELNQRFHSPLKDPGEVKRFIRLVGGHPYLVHRGLYELVHHNIGIESFEVLATRGDWAFGDHLRRILVLLANNPELDRAMREVLRGQPCPTTEAFFHLRSAGVLAGDSSREARPRCLLYASYLERHSPYLERHSA